VKELIFFSSNHHKIEEVKKILENTELKIFTLSDFPKINQPEETGKTFNENAKIKSIFGFQSFKIPCFADDSGICISALNNQPGVRSKRFQEENGGFDKTFEIIINETKEKKNFNAFFQTTIALTIKKNYTVFFEGIVKGKISSQPLGMRGFHYDPIFIPDGVTVTYAQMLNKEKNKISHRAIAINKLKEFLKKIN
jgi:XTP/dITP diphosphohydrolase